MAGWPMLPGIQEGMCVCVSGGGGGGGGRWNQMMPGTLVGGQVSDGKLA